MASRARAYQMIESVEVRQSVELSPMGLKITNERQARALKDVPESEREEVLKRAAETGTVTAKSITEAAKEHAATNGHAKPAKEERPRRARLILPPAHPPARPDAWCESSLRRRGTSRRVGSGLSSRGRRTEGRIARG